MRDRCGASRHRRVIVELDGGQHSQNPEDKRHDSELCALGYRAIRVWHVHGELPGNWRELQRRAGRQGAPLDALYVD